MLEPDRLQVWFLQPMYVISPQTTLVKIYAIRDGMVHTTVGSASNWSCWICPCILACWLQMPSRQAAQERGGTATATERSEDRLNEIPF